MAVVDTVRRQLRSGAWRREGWPDLLPQVPPTDPDPNWPAPGTYRPGPDTTGPRPFLSDGTTPRVLERWDGNYVVNSANAIVENKDIYGQIILQSGATNPIIRNCIIRGPGSGYVGSGKNYIAAISSTSASMRNAIIEDCRIDLRGRETWWCDGIRGGDYTVRRTEIVATIDGISFNAWQGNVVVEACWIHDGRYDEWDVGTPNRPTESDRRAHCDCIQFHRGKGYRVVGNYLGGRRTLGGIQTYDPVIVAQKDAGDDYENSGIMLKQEVDSTAQNKIENVLISQNWFEGGAACINVAPDLGNFFESVTISYNRFIRAQPGVHGGYYIVRPTTTQAAIVGNVFDDTGLPVTIRNG
jgi:hypothetical protein